MPECCALYICKNSQWVELRIIRGLPHGGLTGPIERGDGVNEWKEKQRAREGADAVVKDGKLSQAEKVELENRVCADQVLKARSPTQPTRQPSNQRSSTNATNSALPRARAVPFRHRSFSHQSPAGQGVKVWAMLSGLEALEVGKCGRALGAALNWCPWAGREATCESVTPVQTHNYPSPARSHVSMSPPSMFARPQDNPIISSSSSSISTIFTQGSTPSLISKISFDADSLQGYDEVSAWTQMSELVGKP
ncbi:hypothetical protein FRC09_012648 [Ceratobasidium sp. 395]|nr:hypothetical protein FRC09_012648 [Ceratobasidium sp. 395]